MILSTFWRFSQLIIIIIRHSLLELFQNVIGVRFFLRHSVVCCARLENWCRDDGHISAVLANNEQAPHNQVKYLNSLSISVLFLYFVVMPPFQLQHPGHQIIPEFLTFETCHQIFWNKHICPENPENLAK